ncbi:DUF2288 domain-containing protein [Isoalcanivorax beigongshangi]|uniref:DUF2288 domain-containing protein n=1 Tax=Isoalcanivorax beigongshangi TaxID=3238810 RepID=A0ABV4AIF7_9GAMM
MTDVSLADTLNLETARIEWSALEGFFARGVLLRVGPELDLITVAVAIAEDRRDPVAAWLEQGQLAHVSDADALRFADANSSLWAVVVRPWVLVQEQTDSAGAPTH